MLALYSPAVLLVFVYAILVYSVVSICKCVIILAEVRCTCSFLFGEFKDINRSSSKVVEVVFVVVVVVYYHHLHYYCCCYFCQHHPALGSCGRRN